MNNNNENNFYWARVDYCESIFSEFATFSKYIIFTTREAANKYVKNYKQMNKYKNYIRTCYDVGICELINNCIQPYDPLLDIDLKGGDTYEGSRRI